MYKELLMDLDSCKGNLIAIRESMVVIEGETKLKLVYLTGCPLIFVVVKHILAFRGTS